MQKHDSNTSSQDKYPVGDPEQARGELGGVHEEGGGVLEAYHSIAIVFL